MWVPSELDAVLFFAFMSFMTLLHVQGQLGRIEERLNKLEKEVHHDRLKSYISRGEEAD